MVIILGPATCPDGKLVNEYGKVTISHRDACNCDL